MLKCVCFYASIFYPDICRNCWACQYLCYAAPHLSTLYFPRCSLIGQRLLQLTASLSLLPKLRPQLLQQRTQGMKNPSTVTGLREEEEEEIKKGKKHHALELDFTFYKLITRYLGRYDNIAVIILSFLPVERYEEIVKKCCCVCVLFLFFFITKQSTFFTWPDSVFFFWLTSCFFFFLFVFFFYVPPQFVGKKDVSALKWTIWGKWDRNYS